MSNKEMGFYIYARVSGDDQRKDATIDQQVAAGRQWAKGQGCQSPTILKDDGITGKEDSLSNRPAMMALIEAMKKGIVRTLWVYDSTRLARNEMASAIIKRHIIDNKVSLYIGSKRYDFDNPQDKLLYNMLGAVNVFDKDMIVGRLKRGRDTIAQDGVKITSAFWGYINGGIDPETGRTKWIPNDAKLDIVKRAYAFYLKTPSLLRLITYLGGDASLTVWRKRLQHIEYTGQTYTPDGQIVPCKNFSQVVVSFDDWQRAQELLKFANGHRARTGSSPVSGLIECRACGRKYYRSMSKGIVYYKHMTGEAYGKQLEKCDVGARGYRAELLDSLFDFVYRFGFRNAKDLQAIKDELALKALHADDDKDYEIELFTNKIKQLDKQIKNGEAAILALDDNASMIATVKALQAEKKALVESRKSMTSKGDAVKKSLSAIVKEYTEAQLDYWTKGSGSDKRQVLSDNFKALIDGTVLTITASKTNRHFVFDLDGLTLDKIAKLSKMTPKAFEAIYEVSLDEEKNPMVAKGLVDAFQLGRTMAYTHYLPDPRIYSIVKVVD